MDRDRRVISWAGMAILLALLLILFAIGMHMIGKHRAAVQERDAAMTIQLTDMELYYAQLKDELRRVGTDSYVENEAREKYGFISEGELCFEFTNPAVLNNYTTAEWQIIMDEGLY